MLEHFYVPILSSDSNYTFGYLSILDRLLILFTIESDERIDICSELKSNGCKRLSELTWYKGNGYVIAARI
jgi:hypothetical protein